MAGAAGGDAMRGDAEAGVLASSADAGAPQPPDMGVGNAPDGGGGGAGRGGVALPKPPRAQSTTLDAANLPQISSAPGGGGGVLDVDHSEAPWTGVGAATSHVDGEGLAAAAGGVAPHPLACPKPLSGAPQPPSLDGTTPSLDGDGGAAEPHAEDTSAGGGAPHEDAASFPVGAGAPQPELAGAGAPQPDAAGGEAGGGDIPELADGPDDGGAQACDIAPEPVTAAPAGWRSHADSLTGGAELPFAAHPRHSGVGGAALAAAALAADASSRAAAISN
jgi:hypothetical protein